MLAPSREAYWKTAIDSSRQDLIRRMAGENCFGGAPLIDRRIGFVESRAVSNICSRFSALR